MAAMTGEHETTDRERAAGDLGVALSVAGRPIFSATIPAAMLRAADEQPADAIEEARELAGELARGVTKEAIASRRGCSVDRVVERLALLRLRNELQELISRGRLAHKVGLLLSRLPTGEQIPTAIWAMGGEAGDTLAHLAGGNFLRPLAKVRNRVRELLAAGEKPGPHGLFDGADDREEEPVRAPGRERARKTPTATATIPTPSAATGEAPAGNGSAGGPAGGEEDPVAAEARRLCAAVVKLARTGTAAALATGERDKLTKWLGRLRAAAELLNGDEKLEA